MNFCPFGALVAHFSTTQMQNCLSSTQEESPLSLAQFGVTTSVSTSIHHERREMTPSRWCWSSPGTIPNPPGCLRSGSNLNIPTSPSNLRRASSQTRDWGVCLAGYTKENWILLHSFSPIHKMWFWCLLDVKMSQILSSAISQYQYSDFICIIWTQNL